MSETSELTGPLVKMYQQAGAIAFRMNSGKVKVRGGWMQLAPNGTSDILVFPVSGPVTWVETKIKNGKQNEDQLEFELRVKMFGHRYILARTIDEGMEALKCQ